MTLRQPRFALSGLLSEGGGAELRAGWALSQMRWHESQNRRFAPPLHACSVRLVCRATTPHRAHLKVGLGGRFARKNRLPIPTNVTMTTIIAIVARLIASVYA
jgi:hypothetical protein